MIALAAVVAAGLAVTVAWMATDRRGFAQRADTTTTVVLPAGHEACRGSLEPREAGLNALRVEVDTAGHPGPPLELALYRRDPRPTIVARGRIDSGYRTGVAEGSIRGSATGARTLRVCVRNVGRHPVAITPPRGASSRRVVAKGRTSSRKMSLTLLRKPDATLLSLMPDALRRAELFRPGWLHTWAYWVLAVSLVILVPGLLAVALIRAEREDGGGGPLDPR
ncbi:MAG: hypothetical protein QOD53_2406 [Thermoleophilaceae bacterium]|nr:hypothetical protein [Thermoleophilaceae bacterium]